MTLRSRVHQVLEDSESPVGGFVRWLLATLIVANVIAVVMETVPSVHASGARFFRVFEWFSLLVFAAEYALRLWSAGEVPRYRGVLGRLRWALSMAAVIDLMAELHQGGATTCMVTHDPRWAEHAERTIHLFDDMVVDKKAAVV